MKPAIKLIMERKVQNPGAGAGRRKRIQRATVMMRRRLPVWRYMSTWSMRAKLERTWSQRHIKWHDRFTRPWWSLRKCW